MFGTMGGGGEGANMMAGMHLYYAPPPPPTHFPPPPSTGADTRTEGRKWAQSLLLQRAQHQQRQLHEQQQHEHDAVSASNDGSLKPGEMNAKVGLLPGIRPTFLDKFLPVNEKQRRAQRETLNTLTEEEKQERRKERARMYSHLARRRQEQHVRELVGIVEQLTVYRVMVEEASVFIVIASPDAQAAILFANAPFAARLQLDMVQSLLGRSLLDLVHPLDQDKVRVALYTVSMDHAAKRGVSCRIRGVAMSIAMTHGSQGILCILQEEEEHGFEKRGEGGNEEAQVEEKEGREGEVATTERDREGGDERGSGGGGGRKKRGGGGDERVEGPQKKMGTGGRMPPS